MKSSMMLLQSFFVFVLTVSAAVAAFVQHQPSFFASYHHRTVGLFKAQAVSSSENDAPLGAISTSPDNPIVVFGAGGKTGRLIVQILAEQKHHARAVIRRYKTLDNIPKECSPYVSYAVGDVRSFDSVQEIIQKGAAGVIWAATSSGVKKGGGDATEVDYKGAYFTAKSCLDCKVPKLAFVSAACVTRPESLGSKVVNKITSWTYGDIPWTDAKMAGETAVRDLYKTHNNSIGKTKDHQHLTYVIIRPAAALSDKPPIPPNKLVVMQGDVYSSAENIPRANVANVVVSALMKGKATDFVTIEVAPAARLYKNDEGNFFDLLCLPTLNQSSKLDLPSALVHRDVLTYNDLLDGLVPDEDMAKDYSSIVSDYRGEGVPPVKEFELDT